MKSNNCLFNVRVALVTSFMVLAGSTGANSMLLRGAGEVLKTPAATQAFSRIFGVSQTRLSTMSPEERGRLLEKKINALKQEGKQGLAVDINNFFYQSSQKGLGMESEVGGLIARMPQKKVSVRSLLNASPSSKRMDALGVLRARVNKGEFAPSDVKKFSAIVQSANKALGFDILGESAGNCLQNFSPALVGNFMILVSSLKNPGALTSVQSAFNAMVSKSEKLFGENAIDAERRICGLAGRGYQCNALASQMCAR